MAYTPQTWADSDPSKPLSAARMSVIESGLQAAAGVADSAATQASSSLTAATKGVGVDGIWQNYYNIQGSYYGANVTTPVFPIGLANAFTATTGSQYISSVLFWFDPAEWTVTNYTHKLRLRILAFGASSVGTNTLTFGLYQMTTLVSAVSGYSFTHGASPISGTTVAHANIPANTAVSQSALFDGSTLSAGWYGIGFVTNAAGVANTTFLNCQLDYRYV